MRLRNTRGNSRGTNSQTFGGERRPLDSCASAYEMEGRHDADMLAARRRPADPYAAWLAQREAANDRARLNAHDAWEVLRTDASFEASMR